MSGVNGSLNGQATEGAAFVARDTEVSLVRAQQDGSRGVGFRKAVKFGAKGRIAFVGVAGSGKSFTMLTLARALAGPTGKIAAVDTEHGSLSKYADRFEFDVAEPDSYTTTYLLEQLDYAEQNGYAVFCVDSLSHFWMGKDGALEFVDNAKKRTRDQMEGWKMFRPHERAMVDRFISSPCHILVTMRTKTDYEEQVGSDGKKRRVKIGMAPVQRDGLEYEFDLVCSMDDENTLVVDKTRCSDYSEERMKVAQKPGPKYFEPFIQWLSGVEPPARVKPSTVTPTPYTPAPMPPRGARTPAAQAIAEQKIETGQTGSACPWVTFGEMRRIFDHLREIVGEVEYAGVMEQHGWKELKDIRSKPMAMDAYTQLEFLAQRALLVAQTEVA